MSAHPSDGLGRGDSVMRDLRASGRLRARQVIEDVAKRCHEKRDHAQERADPQQRLLDIQALLRRNDVDGSDGSRCGLVHLLDARGDVLVRLRDRVAHDAVHLLDTRVENLIDLTEARLGLRVEVGYEVLCVLEGAPLDGG